jgi:multiple sugar transport system permease protein
MKPSRTGSLLLAPVIIYLTVMTIFPTGYLVYLSFLNWNLLGGGAQFAGLSNYAEVLSPSSVESAAFYNSLWITLTFAGSLTLIELVLGFAIAVLLARENLIAKLTQGLLVVPLVITPVLLDMIWKYLFNPLLGPITYIASLLGVVGIEYLSSTPNVYYSLAVVDIWQWTPLVILILLGGLLSLPREQFEAAELDGATRSQILRYLTIPMVFPFIIIAVMFRLVDSLKVFNKIYILTAGGPNFATDSLSYRIFYHSLGFVQNVGYGATVSVLFFIIVIGISTVLVLSFSRIILGGRRT